MNDDHLKDSVRFLKERIGSVEFETFPGEKEGEKVVKIRAETYENAERIGIALKEMSRRISSPETIMESTREIMPVLTRIQEEYKEDKPLSGHVVLVNTHLKENTGILMFVLKKMGARPIAVPVPYSRDSKTFTILSRGDIPVYTKEKDGKLEHMHMDEMDEYIRMALEENKVDLILEDGAWISKFIANNDIDSGRIIGSVEQTKAGVTIARNELGTHIAYPILTVGDAELKEAAESETATPESIVRMVITSLNRSIMGKIVAVVGYGHVGKGIAEIARNLGGRIRIVDTDPTAILSALNNGFDVLRLEDAVAESDILITATGRPQDNPVPFEVVKSAKNGIMLANAGSKREIDVDGLEANATSKEYLMREGVTRYTVCHEGKEKSVLLVADGYPINLALGEGTPSDAIDITLSLMVEGAIHLVTNRGKISSGVQGMPNRISTRVARFKLESMSLSCL